MIYSELLMVAFIAIFIADLSGFPDVVKEKIREYTRWNIRRLRPLDCSLCLVWWCCLLYAWICGELNIWTAGYSAMLSLLAWPVGNVIRLALDLLNKWVSAWAWYFDKDNE